MKRILEQSDEDKNLAMQVLAWTSYAKRPLKIIELQHALSTSEGNTDLDESAFTDEELLISVCAGIVTIDEKNSVIRFVHYTTQQYFEKCRDKLFFDVRITIAITCLTYLSFNIFDEPCLDQNLLNKRLSRYTFSIYAARYWADHCRGEIEANVCITLLRTFRPQGKRDSLAEIVENIFFWTYNYPTRLPLLHVIAGNGLVMTAQSLLCNTIVDEDLYAYIFIDD